MRLLELYTLFSHLFALLVDGLVAILQHMDLVLAGSYTNAENSVLRKQELLFLVSIFQFSFQGFHVPYYYSFYWFFMRHW